MKRYFIYLSYNGTRYHGWQIQPNAVTVQETLENALATVLRRKIDITGAGRTDTGVHAEQMTAHFDFSESFDAENLITSLNSLLPPDIAIRQITPVKPGAHARFDAMSRRYEYRVSFEKNPFRQDTVCRIFRQDLDFEQMNKAAQKLFNYTDFTSFSKLHTDNKTNNCKITKAEWIKTPEGWTFVIEADRFLRNMVRAIVGTLFEVGRGKISVRQFCEIIERKNRSLAGTSAPAQGLFLVKVEYPPHLFLP
ncbi:MAG: tRNA pseudouridine(38-40) synthase TruA [Prevotellaceae bacterium]|jgi:tRNA pseudouridine38-40 synthase|nr:tRNA pseudouridine(38-40) synthase TruA [Prevotellaceae bacterium]